MYIVAAPISEKLAITIQPYREQYDPLARVIPPHIALLSPFEFSEPFEILYEHLRDVGQAHAPIKASVAGWDIYHYIDYQLRLPIISGQAEFIALREHLLTGPLEYCPGQDKDYSPHIRLGQLMAEAEVAGAKSALAGFEPQFIFRVTHLELLRWHQQGQPWKLEKRFGLEATLSGSRRKNREQRREE
jgi:2'-5' RNA ligase